MLLLVKYNENGMMEFQSDKTKEKFRKFKSHHVLTGEWFTLSLAQLEKKTSEQQKRLFNGFVIKVAEQTGNDFRSVQKEFMNLLPDMGKGELDLFGEPIVERMGINDLNFSQFDQFLSDCVTFTEVNIGLKYSIYTDDEIGTVIKLDE